MNRTRQALKAARHHLGLSTRSLQNALFQARKANASAHSTSDIHVTLTLNRQARELIQRLIARSYKSTTFSP